MQLILKSCTIRPWRLDDTESFAKHANNPASARVLEKAGFVFEGCLKNNVIKDGKLLDSLLYAKTRQKIDVVVPELNGRRLISRCDRTSRPLHRGPRGRFPTCEGWD
jgi:hypothetical protein